MVFDTQGNVGIAVTGGFKGKSDIEGGLSVNATVSYNMESVDDMNGTSAFLEGGQTLGKGLRYRLITHILLDTLMIIGQ
ncbi:hypothetical protein HNQ80_003355 [Anaerosolibacter carboniphilus]|uniref:Uncharacterized protein n=1 Tax=Anaerosolibacter carboniphilus TaxID=1417629 RepID=A0A841KUE2_9FIRM|nr:hypothetical protein [Anaerosolibacter carboniphilus]MBB6217236.1 hypothetical protein [Anaerosolibacter carboniphilus]